MLNSLTQHLLNTQQSQRTEPTLQLRTGSNAEWPTNSGLAAVRDLRINTCRRSGGAAAARACASHARCMFAWCPPAGACVCVCRVTRQCAGQCLRMVAPLLLTVAPLLLSAAALTALTAAAEPLLSTAPHPPPPPPAPGAGSSPVAHRIAEWEGRRLAGTGVAGVRAVARRLLGEEDAARFAFEALPPVGNGSTVATFELGSSVDGKPQIKGSSTVALAAGFYHYLKYYANCSVSVGAAQLALPATLPLPPPSAHPSPLQFHWFGSFMANSYTQAFWLWERWESHLDWCALMGFDLVMVYAGAEHVHAEVYLEMGVTETELGSFFSGAAFLGWSSTRAGNIRGLAGPISPAWRANKAEMGKKIVARCRELGITPVLSGFNGHVPEALVKRLHPHANHTRARPWNAFNCTDVGTSHTSEKTGATAGPNSSAGLAPAVAPPYGCGFELEPTDPLFLEVGARFIKKQAETFGDDVHFFAYAQAQCCLQAVCLF